MKHEQILYTFPETPTGHNKTMSPSIFFVVYLRNLYPFHEKLDPQRTGRFGPREPMDLENKLTQSIRYD